MIVSKNQIEDMITTEKKSYGILRFDEAYYKHVLKDQTTTGGTQV